MLFQVVESPSLLGQNCTSSPFACIVHFLSTHLVGGNPGGDLSCVRIAAGVGEGLNEPNEPLVVAPNGCCLGNMQLLKAVAGGRTAQRVRSELLSFIQFMRCPLGGSLDGKLTMATDARHFCPGSWLTGAS